MEGGMPGTMRSIGRSRRTFVLLGTLTILLALEQYMITLRNDRPETGPATRGSQTSSLAEPGPKHSKHHKSTHSNKKEPPDAKVPQWKVKLCHVKGGPAGRPELAGLPVSLPKKVQTENIFVHRKNFMALHMEDVINNLGLLYPNSSAILGHYRWESCAVVGNSGGLKLTRFGDSINSHSVILRTNQAPVDGYRAWVGSRTTFRMLNNLWTFRYINMKDILKERAEENPVMPLEPGVTLLLTRVAGAQFDDMAVAVRHQRRDVRVLLVSSRAISAARRLLAGYRDRLCKAGYGPYLGGSTPSSGFVSVYIMMQLCQRVTLYGFGSKDDSGRKVKYHYYRGFGARDYGTLRQDGSPVHCWDAEAEVMEALSQEGHIKICRPAKGNSTVTRQRNRSCGAYNQ